MATADLSAAPGAAPLESPAYEIVSKTWATPQTQPQALTQSIINQIRPRLARTAEDPRPVVVMTCGIAGAGKSTLSKTIIAKEPTYERLSCDKLVHDKYGLYGIDFPREKHAGYLEEAQGNIKSAIAALIKDGSKNGVLDLSFYNKEYRDEYKTIIEGAGGRWVLVFLDATKELLWSRIQGRRAARDKLPAERGSGRDGDSAYDIEPETFEMYWSGFEPPTNEGEIRVQVV